jgi:PPOX class probable F420-dependent enzyme
MATIPDSVRDLIASGPLGHMVTLNPDGSPQVTCVWVGLEGAELVTAHLGAWRKVQNVQRDPRVAISMDAGGVAPNGLASYLVVYGRARVEEGGAPELLQRLAHIYLGPDVKFPSMEHPPPDCALHLTPDRFAGNGPWSAG